MLEFKLNKLILDRYIQSHDSIVTLHSDMDSTIVGVLTLSNGVTKTLCFIKENNLYKARLVITEEDLPYINSNCTFYLIMVDGNTQKTSNVVDIKFDVAKIKKTIKLSASNDIKDIKVNLAQLTKRLEDVISKAPSFMVTSATPINTAYVKPGMIPVAIDETGRCIFQYPFIDHVTEINGQKTVNNAILLTAKDIPIEQTDVDSAIKAHTDAIKELNNLMKTISSELKSTKNKVADIEKALLQHTESSII